MIVSPVLIIGCARSGTTLLYNVLSEVEELWSIGYESKAIIERHHSPATRDWESGALAAGDLTAVSRAGILSAFEAAAAPGRYWRRVNQLRRALNRTRAYAGLKRRGRAGVGAAAALPGAGLGLFRALARARRRLSPRDRPIRLLEKTPENCLRLPFLQALFPDARVIFLVRDGRANAYSLMEGWRQPHLFPGYRPPLLVTSPGQTRGRWAFTLIPGWRDLVDRPLEEICAAQWSVCNATVLDYAATPGALPVLAVRYEDLVADPRVALARIAGFLDLHPDRIPARAHGLPEVNVISSPGYEKWRAEAGAIARVSPLLEPVMSRLGYDAAA